jgi:hypothetical protein
MTISRNEIVALLSQRDRQQLEYIAGMAMAAALETYPPEERYRALDDAMQTFRRGLPGLS